MAEIDLFANELLEEAKRFFEKVGNPSDPAHLPHLHAALMLSLCALEAHINAVSEEFASQPNLSAHERGFLIERDVKMENGVFQLTNSLRMSRLEDRIDFLHSKLSGSPPDRSAMSWRGRLAEAISLRNTLTHARTVPSITEPAVRQALQAIIDTLDALYKAIYKRPFPGAGRGLNSRLDF